MKLACPKCGDSVQLAFKEQIESHVVPRFGLFGPLVLRERKVGRTVRCARCLHEFITSPAGVREIPALPRVALPETDAPTRPTPERAEPKRDTHADPIGLSWAAKNPHR